MLIFIAFSFLKPPPMPLTSSISQLTNMSISTAVQSGVAVEAESWMCYPPRPSASMDNTLLDLLNSSYPTQPHSLIAK